MHPAQGKSIGNHRCTALAVLENVRGIQERRMPKCADGAPVLVGTHHHSAEGCLMKPRARSWVRYASSTTRFQAVSHDKSMRAASTDTPEPSPPSWTPKPGWPRSARSSIARLGLPRPCGKRPRSGAGRRRRTKPSRPSLSATSMNVGCVRRPWPSTAGPCAPGSSPRSARCRYRKSRWPTSRRGAPVSIP